MKNEQLFGQLFSIDFSLWLDFDESSVKDDLSYTVDYSIGIKKIQEISFKIKCSTIEHFSELILDQLELIYGEIPMQVKLRKCSAPII